jgi:hypothetical protein
MDLNTLFAKMKAAFSVDIPFWKPNCSGTNMLLIHMQWLNLLYIIFTNTLENVVNSANGMYFVMLALSTFLYRGFTIEILRLSGKIPVCSE